MTSIAKQPEKRAKKMSDEPRNGHVTYKWLLTITGGLFGAAVTAGFIGWQVHASQPHHGAVRDTEYDRGQAAIFSRLDRIEDKVDSLLSKP